MLDLLVVTDVRLVDASPVDVRRGLLGFVSCTLNGSVRLDGLTLRRSRAGRPAISFPARRDAQGRSHALVRILDAARRRDIEAQIFLALGISQEVPR